MFVAIPTAIPTEPLTKMFGKRDGRTVGSFKVLSKFGTKSMTFLSMSASISFDRRSRRASV